MNSNQSLLLTDEAATIRVGKALAGALKGRELITLTGDLGAGKTTLCRGLIRALGHTGPVKSPTFTLVEPYEIGPLSLAHFDLYRLNDPEELEFMGIRDYLDGHTVCLVEWPERAGKLLPAPDLALSLTHENTRRRLQWRANTETGDQLALILSRL